MHVTLRSRGEGERTAAIVFQEEREGNRLLGRPPRRKAKDNSDVGLT
jgi:hypothetical protein